MTGMAGGGNQALVRGDMPVELKGLGRWLADWVRMRGEGASETADAAVQDAPPEYRELVKRYFSEVARRGREEATPRKP